MSKRYDKPMAILAIILGIFILVRPELLSWMIAIVLMVWGVTRLV